MQPSTINPNMTQAELLALVAKLQADNAKLKSSQPSGGIKLSEKGAVSVYGLGRFPVTLYGSQWEKLFAKTEDIKAFIQANKAKIDEAEARKAAAKA